MGMGLYVVTTQMKKLSVEHAAYLAGIIDGEGHITITSCAYRGRQKLALMVGVSNNSLELLEWILITTGCGKIYHRSRFHNKGCVWNLTGSQNVIFLLEQIIPYLILKKDQAILAIEYCGTITKRRRGLYGRLSSDILSVRNDMREKMMKLNKQLKYEGR